MLTAKEILQAALHLFFPHTCAGCGAALHGGSGEICLHCLAALPATGFENNSDNAAAQLFFGRLPVDAATACYFFNRASRMQELVHALKYGGNRPLGVQLGRLMGELLLTNSKWKADLLVPLPLHARKERKRGYNQATLLCEGISIVTGIPVAHQLVIRSQYTDSQTRKGRIERWQNMEGKFRVPDPAAVQGKRLLLVDDVITTGATLEACGAALLEASPASLQIACLCIASE